MRRIFSFFLLSFVALNFTSCLLLSDIHTVHSSREDRNISYRIRVDIENRTNETIIVNLIRNRGSSNERELTITTIPKGRTSRVNIRRGSTIIITGGNTQRRYLETIVENDFEQIVVR